MYFVDLASTAQARSKLNRCQALNAFDPPVIEVLSLRSRDDTHSRFARKHISTRKRKRPYSIQTEHGQTFDPLAVWISRQDHPASFPLVHGPV